MRLSWLPLLLVSTAGCGSGNGMCASAAPGQTREPDEYTGCGSDEHWITFDDQEGSGQVMVDDQMAPVFSSPQAGATIPYAAKPVFAWSQDPINPGNTTGPGAGDVTYMTGPGCNNCCPEFNIGALTTLHLPAISGDLYDLQFLVGGGVSHRVITTLQEWTPPASTWSCWRGQSVGLKIVRMTVLSNSVKAGPFTPSHPFAFSVGK
jgi:hypothetical protein